MKHPKQITYAGRKYWLQSNGRYYQDGSHNAPERLLHRAIWVERHGPIPAGMCVHHRNGDWTDNADGNLELKTTGKHMQDHSNERFSNSAYRARNKKLMNRIRPLASAWHKSKAGSAWHSKNTTHQWKTRTPKVFHCAECKKSFESKHFVGGKRFCSTRCSNRHRERRLIPVSRICKVCGADFMAHRYRTTEHCSRHCAATTTARVKAGLRHRV